MNSSESLLIQLARRFHLDKIGFTSDLIIDKPIPPDDDQNFSWVVDRRFHNPRLSVPWAKSMVVGIISYYQDIKNTYNPLHGNVAMYTRGDYYHLLRKKLTYIAREFKKSTGCRISKTYVNGPFNEKEYARRAGLGYIASNSLLISDQLGSFTVIGLFLTDARLENSEIIDKSCRLCGQCELHCPTGALNSGVIDRNKCIQELSQRDLIIPDEIKLHWGNRFYGCDQCQLCCPLNQNLTPQNHKPLRGVVGEKVDVYELIKLDPLQIKQKFKGNQMGAGWVSPFALIRNAVLVLSHQKVKLTGSDLDKLKGYFNPGINDALTWNQLETSG
ncbi:MAG: hypothetical protein APR63_13080 [Desulfuromonas sp. SDB]|nr:MAG: hypothetical protein APR63_13080 [Desulfuromonas sp. SDB]